MLLLHARRAAPVQRPRLARRAATRLTWKGKPVLQMASVGSFAEYMITPESGVVKIPNDMPMAEAALIGCGVMTGVGAALYTAKVPGGAICAVMGCGGIGLNVIQGCELAGAAEIIAIDVVPGKLEMAQALRRDPHDQRQGATRSRRCRSSPAGWAPSTRSRRSAAPTPRARSSTWCAPAAPRSWSA